jgi:hypothetical protein
VTLERATYSRNASGTRVAVFAKAPNNASLCLRNGLALVGTPPSPCQFSMLADNNGLFFSQQLSQAAPPPVVVVTASSTAANTARRRCRASCPTWSRSVPHGTNGPTNA